MKEGMCVRDGQAQEIDTNFYACWPLFVVMAEEGQSVFQCLFVKEYVMKDMCGHVRQANMKGS